MPLGVAKLKSLQTLSKIIIGGENDFSITHLKDFENLHGKVSIEGLEKVKDAREAREANLSQKRLTKFEVEWSDVSDACRKDTTENDVLDALKPYNDCLEKLGIVNYMGLEFPKWVADSSFRQLARVSIRGCKKCTFLPPLGQLQSLKKLSIQDMDDVKVVGSEFFGTGLAFPSLESLSFRNMLGWKVWSTNGRSGVGDSVFPCLKELLIEYCPNLAEVSLNAPLLSLRNLRINKCGNRLMRSLVHVAPSVTMLRIESISGLTNEVWRGVILDLKSVELLDIKYCDELRYLSELKEPEASSTVLLNLRNLAVRNCKNMVSLGEKDTEEHNYGSNLLTSLRSLVVYGCEFFKHLRCPNNIEMLIISHCHSITRASFSMGGGQNLKSVSIYGSEKVLLEEELGGGEKNVLVINSKTMPLLQSVSSLYHPNVSSIIEIGSNFIHLTSLTIEGCKSTRESLFADLQLQSLTSLNDLEIRNCPSMDAPAAGLLWPPNLRKLSIGRLKKPISEWGPQNFPSTLVDLCLWGKREAVSNWNELSHLHLPSSLTRLGIYGFDNLEAVSEELEHVCIWDCPKMKDLPEMLLRSLLSLTIGGCPDLKERCTRGGSYWTLISHIPCIRLLELWE